ncbi:TrbI/VirB10 family protein [Ralstonia pickettii]|nr:TrbI/VirB10 family protein [Ralstonia pickettii]
MATPDRNAAPMTNEPAARTRVRRGLAKTIAIFFGATILAIVFVRHFTHPRETADERARREQLEQLAKEPPASGDALAQKLEGQFTRAQTEHPAPAAPAAPPSGPVPRGMVGSASAPAAVPAGAPGAQDGLTPEQRLALQRASQDTDSMAVVSYGDREQGAAANAGTNPISDYIASLQRQQADKRTGPADTTAAAIQQQVAAMAASSNQNTPGSAANSRRVAWQGQQANQGQSAALTPQSAESPFMVMPGTPIPVVLNQGVNSDMPGQYSATVDRDIYDSINGSCKLIAKGTRIVGASNSDVAIGQERMQMGGALMIFRNGASMVLDGLNGADPNGEAGVTADVNNHFFKIFGSTFLIAGVAQYIGRNQSQPSGTTLNINGGGGATGLTSAAGQAVSQTTQTILQRNSNIQPTLRLDPGQKLVFITKAPIHIPPTTVAGECYQ